MNQDACFAMLDNPQGHHQEALKTLLIHATPSALQGLIARLILPHLQPLQTALHKGILLMVENDKGLQEHLINAFIDAADDLQEALMSVMAQLGANALMLDKLSQACMKETNAERGHRFLTVMKGLSKDWDGVEGQHIRDKLAQSEFVHRALFLPQELKTPAEPVRLRHLSQMLRDMCSKHWND